MQQRVERKQKICGATFSSSFNFSTITIVVNHYSSSDLKYYLHSKSIKCNADIKLSIVEHFSPILVYRLKNNPCDFKFDNINKLLCVISEI